MVYSDSTHTEKSPLLSTTEKDGGNPTSINILLSVIDNLGDIGFACELVASFEAQFPGQYHFDIWTHDCEKVSEFFDRNREILTRGQGGYSEKPGGESQKNTREKYCFTIHDITHIDERTGNVTLLLFHHPLPPNYKKYDHELILRIDYLSFDPKWVAHNGTRHIHSTDTGEIIELIPSPLPEGAGLIQRRNDLFTKDFLAQKYSLDPQKKWISLFIYKDTLKRIIYDLTDEYEVIVFGKSPQNENNKKKGVLKPVYSENPLPLLDFQSFIATSAWCIIRGEVSFISTLQIGTPFFWDMYKSIGGYFQEQAEDFLAWKDDPHSEPFFRCINESEDPISLTMLDTYFAGSQEKKNGASGGKDLVGEIKKYIDNWGFSI